METSTKARLEWIDTLRGLAMLFVIFSHAIVDGVPNRSIYYVVTGPIMLPLFLRFPDTFSMIGQAIKKLFTKIYFLNLSYRGWHFLLFGQRCFSYRSGSRAISQRGCFGCFLVALYGFCQHAL